VKFDGVADAGNGEIASGLREFEGRGVGRAGAGAADDGKYRAESQIAEVWGDALTSAAILFHEDEPSIFVLT
jgi:hypothetical protein